MSTDKDFILNIGKSIKTYRKLINISQSELANKIGMDKQNLWAIEKGKSNPQVLTLLKIASGLGITLPLLLSFDFNYEEFSIVKQKYKPRKHKKT